MHKRAILVLLMAASIGGCMVGKSGKSFVYAFDAGLIVGGGVVAGSALSADCTPDDATIFHTPGVAACTTGKVFLTAIGVGLAAAGLIAMGVTSMADGGDNQEPGAAADGDGVTATQGALDKAARERARCDEYVAAYRAARRISGRAELLRDMPTDCRVRARASTR